MAFEMTKVSYSGKILDVNLGQAGKQLVVGGETSYPFHLFEGKMPHRPMVAMEVWDMEPEDWPAACLEPFADVVKDPGAWAKKCVEQYGAQAIVLQLKSTDPNGADAPPAKASEAVGKVLAAVDVPLIVWGSANAAKDAEVLKKIAEDYDGKNLLLGPVDEDNHKAVGAACLAYKHSVIASSPIDVNLAKQLNILLTNLGVPLERIVIDPTTGGLGYGMEYCYSVMERIRMAALVQEDDKLILPMINNVGNEVWKSKEAKLSDAEAPELGDSSMRGVLMEATAAVAFLLAGSDILILRHPKTVELVKGFMESMLAERAQPAQRVKTDRPKAAAVAGAKPAAAKPAPAAAPKPAAAPPKPAAAAAAAPKPAPAAAPAAAAAPKPAAAPAPSAEAEAAAKAAAETKAAEDAKKRAEAEAAAKAKAAEEAKKQAEAAAKQKAEAEEKAREAAKAKEADALADLRKKRREEREKRAAEAHAHAGPQEGVEYGKDREAGVAGSDGIYIIRSLERWSLRGPGYLR